MKVIQELYVDGANYAKFILESDVKYTSTMFEAKGFVSAKDETAELEAVLAAAVSIFKDRKMPEPFLHNPAEFTIQSNYGVAYDGNITESGNVFVLQTRYDDDEVYQMIAFEGSRGRYIVELENLLHGLKRVEPEIYGSIADISKGVEPLVYETTGPCDMLPHEDAYAYAIRMYKEGNKEHVIYWLKMAVASLYIDDTPPATSHSIVYYISERDADFKEKWTKMVASIEATRIDAIDVCYNV